MYYPLIDIAVLGLFLLGLGFALKFGPERRYGATKVSREELKRHQAERRVLIKEGAFK